MVQPRVRSEEEYEAWLDREEIPTWATTDIETLQEFMEDRAEREPHAYGWPQEIHIQKLWGMVEQRFAWAEVGIKPFKRTVGLDWEIRYGIKGMPGSWGFETARNIWESRAGRFWPD